MQPVASRGREVGVPGRDVPRRDGQYEAERDLGDGAALARYLEAPGSLRAVVQQRVQVGTEVADPALKVDYFRLEALAQAKRP